jgi:hypothetical protein
MHAISFILLLDNLVISDKGIAIYSRERKGSPESTNMLTSVGIVLLVLYTGVRADSWYPPFELNLLNYKTKEGQWQTKVRFTCLIYLPGEPHVSWSPHLSPGG